MCYDYLFPEKLTVFSQWCHADLLRVGDIDENIISVYKKRVVEAYGSYFQTSSSIIDPALKKIEDMQ